MLQLIEERLSRGLCDDVMEVAWSTMWNVTDETALNCKRFLEHSGMQFFLNCLKVCALDPPSWTFSKSKCRFYSLLENLTGVPQQTRTSSQHDGLVGQRGWGGRTEAAINDHRVCHRLFRALVFNRRWNRSTIHCKLVTNYQLFFLYLTVVLSLISKGELQCSWSPVSHGLGRCGWLDD